MQKNIENAVAQGEVNMESSLWDMAEAGHDLTVEIYECAKRIFTNITGDPGLNAPPFEIPKDSELNLKAIIRHQNTLLCGTKNALEYLLAELPR